MANNTTIDSAAAAINLPPNYLSYGIVSAHKDPHAYATQKDRLLHDLDTRKRVQNEVATDCAGTQRQGRDALNYRVASVPFGSDCDAAEAKTHRGEKDEFSSLRLVDEYGFTKGASMPTFEPSSHGRWVDTSWVTQRTTSSSPTGSQNSIFEDLSGATPSEGRL